MNKETNMSNYTRAFQALAQYIEDRACHDVAGMATSRALLDAEVAALPDGDVTRDLVDALREV